MKKKLRFSTIAVLAISVISFASVSTVSAKTSSTKTTAYKKGYAYGQEAARFDAKYNIHDKKQHTGVAWSKQYLKGYNDGYDAK